MVSRINLHENDKSELHCMIISKKKGEDTPIMCHPDKDMIFFIFDGMMEIEFYDESGEFESFELARPYPDDWMMLIPKKQYYKMIPLTNVEYVEVNKGPFNKKTHNRYLK